MSVPDFWEANSESDEENPKISFEQMKKQLREYYDPSIIHTYSSALDILASFIKCQAFIYNEASNFCRFRLNMLMFPCIFLSSVCSIFSNTSYPIIYVSGMNAFISFLLAIVNFLKLDANAEAHQISSNHYSKLRTILEFSSGEVLLFSNPLLQIDGVEKEMDIWKQMNILHKTNEKSCLYDDYYIRHQAKINSLYEERDKIKKEMIIRLQEKIFDIKKKVIEIRESNRFSVPKYIMNRYPVIFNINIFSFIKTVHDYKNACISTLKNIKNEIRYLSGKKNLTKEEQQKIKLLYEEKLDIMKELFALSSTYNLIDIMFQQEIKNNILFKKYFYLFYLQKITSIIGYNVLPPDYKDPYDCGYVDKKTNKSLLRKILNT
jgi:hypothetical protein